ncbi:MAG: ATP-binding cassette domain-containing protein, partial [Phycisphaeraceae bacterium]
LRLAGEREPVIRERVDEMLHKLNIERRATHRPDALSGGEQQRVAIGRALVTRPAVVLADEPTGNLDSSNSIAICRLLRDLNETEGVSIVLVTHEPSVGMYARDAVFIRDGQLCHRAAIADMKDAVELANLYQTLLAAPASP